MIKNYPDITNLPKTNYKGSIKTSEFVAEQIEKRWGKQARVLYRPENNCMTMRAWNARGYRVKENETALHCLTFLTKKNGNGEIVKIPKQLGLFFMYQVLPNNS